MTDVGKRLQPIIDAHIDDTFPACALCVWHGGRLILDQAWGWIDPLTQRMRTRTDTLFDLASISKLFTTTAFLSLVSDGVIGLDDPLVTVIPEFGIISPRAINGGQDPHTKQRLATPPHLFDTMVNPAEVTFRHLLTHTSGLPAWRDVFLAANGAPVPPDKSEPLPRSLRWALGLVALCRYSFVNKIGAAVLYSDIGLMLLGEAVTRLHGGVDLVQAVSARVTRPLGIEAVYNPVSEHGIERNRIAPTEDDPTWRKRRVWGEVHDENACGVGGVAGHAGLFASASAVAALGQAWLEGAVRFNIDLALAADAVRQHAETDGARRGLGFALRARENASAGDHFSLDTFGHTGFTGTSLWVDPQHGLVVACLTNSVYPGRWHGGTQEFRRAVHDTIFEAVA